MDLAERVQSLGVHFSSTEREILAFVLANEQFVADATVSAVARRTYTSTSSVIRLTQKLGFAGFAELKFFIRHSLTQTPPSSKELVLTLRTDVEETFSRLEATDLEPVVRQLAGAGTLYCYATGYAQRLATKEFAKTLISCRVFATVLPTAHEFAAAVSIMRPEDVVLIVSLSGATEGLEDVLAQLRLRGIPVICIASRTDGYIAQQAERTLTYASTPTMTGLNSGLFHSFAGLTVLLDYVARSVLVHVERAQLTATSQG